MDENWNAYPNQWVDELNKFLEIKEEPPEYETKTGKKKKRDSVIGILHGSKNTLTGIVDVAMVGSMYGKGKFNELINSYGMVIMDECHHAASNTSMELLQKINAKYVYGVSATPKRGDSLDKIIYMLLGPLRHRFTALERAQEQGIGHYFVPRYTRVVDTVDSKEDINKAYSLISANKVRNEMIVSDVKKCVAQSQTPVILTRFKEHAKFLYDTLKNEADHVFLLYGDNSDKENADIRVKLKQVSRTESLILIATGQKIGEGFDFPRLDVLMLAAPVSFEGRLEQYVGRLNRDYEGKEAVEINKTMLQSKIYFVRNQKVMLDFELAEIYGYTTKAFNQQVKNNEERFDEDFRFKLTREEVENLRSKNLTSSWGGSRYLPYAFTEQGIYMLMTVLKGDLAIRQSKALIRTFKRMKDYIIENQGLIGERENLQMSMQVTQNVLDTLEIRHELNEVEDQMADVVDKLSTVVYKSDLSDIMT